MSRWADLDSQTRGAIAIFIIIVIVLIILFWTGVFIWDPYPVPEQGNAN